jgi:hypothetical protein
LWKFSLKKLIDKTAVEHEIDEKTLDDQFDYVKSLCANNPHQKAIVTAARSHVYLHFGKAEIAAKSMAHCPVNLMPFTDTALRLAMPIFNFGVTLYSESDKAFESLRRSNFPLITYLSEKIRCIKANNDDSMITSLLGSWLVELFLHERRRAIDSKSAIRSNTIVTATASIMQQFLLSNDFHLDSKTVIQSFAYHDMYSSECSAYAIACGDIETAVNVTLFAENSMVCSWRLNPTFRSFELTIVIVC